VDRADGSRGGLTQRRRAYRGRFGWHRDHDMIWSGLR
jgi:hypothetical protein